MVQEAKYKQADLKGVCIVPRREMTEACTRAVAREREAIDGFRAYWEVDVTEVADVLTIWSEGE